MTLLDYREYPACGEPVETEDYCPSCDDQMDEAVAVWARGFGE